MPVALDKRFTNWVSLPAEKDLPESERPQLEVRFIGYQQEQELDAVWKQGEDVDAKTYRQRLVAFLSPLVIGTRNFGITPAPAGADALAHLVLGELQDLAVEIYVASQNGYYARKAALTKTEAETTPPPSQPSDNPGVAVPQAI